MALKTPAVRPTSEDLVRSITQRLDRIEEHLARIDRGIDVLVAVAQAQNRLPGDAQRNAPWRELEQADE